MMTFHDKGGPPIRFAALDFETADYGRDSACALSVVTVEDHQIIGSWTRLIRPPRQSFVFTYIHGISWEDVKDQPTFKELWSEIAPLLEEVEFVAAHNANFDRAVLNACCESAGISPVRKPFLCTMRLARQVWHFYPTKLSDVCRNLAIPLKHHDAASDAHACARIMMAAWRNGHHYQTLLKHHAISPRR